MTREYFKKQPDTKGSKFKEFCKARGADYFEDNYGVWKMSKKCGSKRAAFKIDDKMFIEMGIIDESCDNFEEWSGRYYKEEVLWIANTLNHIFKK